MGRIRKPLKKILEGKLFLARFKHPLRNAVRFVLGTESKVADENLDFLNRIFLNPNDWRNPPATIPEHIRRLWLGDETKNAIAEPPAEDAQSVALGALVDKDYWRAEALTMETRAIRAERTIQIIHKQKIRVGPSPALSDAKTDWLKHYVGRDKDHRRNVESELARFVKKFSDGREVDSFIGAELEIKNYLTGLGVSPGRRNQIRLMILRFLEDSGAIVDRKQIPAAGARAVAASRGPVRWLEKSQAQALADKLPAYWRQLFRVNVGLGLRPEEIPTLHRDNFSPDLSVVTLAPREHLTLKTGSRSINVPAVVRAIILERLDECDIVFPQVAYGSKGHKWKPADSKQRKKQSDRATSTGALWKTVHWFDRKYLRMLRAAKDAVNADKALPAEVKINVELDARIARRTCGSLMLRGGRSVEDVSAVLGSDPATIRKHYARIISHEVDPSAAAI